MKYTLHCFAQSGNAYKAALMMNLCGADWQPEFVDFFNGGSKTPEYLALNSMGEVPVLVADELVISQSGVILDYLAAESGKFGGKTATERREVLRWILFDNHKLTSYFATLRFMRQFTGQEENDVTRFLAGRTEAALKVLERRVSDSEFVAGEQPTIADISLCGYLFWPEEAGFDWQAFPGIEAWLSRIQALPGWVHPYELMPGYPLLES
ncbi:MAG: glutathione S-transferase [Granulosicoccus sp.]